MKKMQTFYYEAASTKAMKERDVQRVAAYCRVSTLQEEQEESFETQCDYFRKHIESNKKLLLVDVYGDHGISGLSVKKRPEFSRMMDDCRDGKIDLIMTKSISRFARNLADCISCIRELKDMGIPVIFEKESLNTLDTGCDMLISVLAALAQEESNNISRSIRWANEYRNSAGTPTRPARYGYQKKGLKWEIFEPEAERVRIAFHMAAEGNEYKNIIKALNELERRDNTKIVWNRQRIHRMLTNETYIGDILTNKSYKPDMLTGKQIKNRGERNQYYIEGHHEAIVGRDIFECVKEMIKSGSLRTKRNGRRTK